MEDTMNQEIPLLTFNSLYNLLREEKKTKMLQKFPELFYQALEKFLNEKNNEIIRLKSQGDNDKLKKEKLVLKNSKMIANSLLSIRAKKITNIAIENQVENDVLDENNILEKEKDLFDKVQREFLKLIRSVK